MSNPFVGEIRMFGGNFAPKGWALCNGQLLAISQNTALFSLLGTQYGGDGKTTFALPDLSREETGNLEAQRKANGLEGVKFLYFHCPACGMDDMPCRMVSTRPWRSMACSSARRNWTLPTTDGLGFSNCGWIPSQEPG